jgi:type IV pilus assembly protein PilA
METKPVMSITTALKARREALTDREAGFTLIELLVVVVIIGILVAIAIPLYLHFENGAKASSAETDTHALTNLVKLCESDNGGTMPASVATITQPAVFKFAEAGCVNDTQNLSKTNAATYTLNADGTFTITVKNTESGKTATYTSADGQTVLTG